ncbi:transposase [Streptomyces sp. NPDC005181]
MRDTELKELIHEVHQANYRVYGARKIWQELNRRAMPWPDVSAYT